MAARQIDAVGGFLESGFQAHEPLTLSLSPRERERQIVAGEF
jgi:hypothetical protein